MGAQNTFHVERASRSVGKTSAPRRSLDPSMPEPFDPYYTWLGIPPEEQPADFYRLLGLKRFEENREVISHAADQRMTHIRSFQSGQHVRESQRLLNELSKASGCLLNPRRKGMYDQHLRTADTTARQAEALLPPDEDNSFGIQIEPVRGSLASPPRRARNARRMTLRSKAILLLIGGVALVASVIVITVFVGRGTLGSGDANRPIDANQATGEVPTASLIGTAASSSTGVFSEQKSSTTNAANGVSDVSASKPVEANIVSTNSDSVGKPTGAIETPVTSAPENKPAQSATGSVGPATVNVGTEGSAGGPSSPAVSVAAPSLDGRPKALRFAGSERIVLANSQGLIDFKKPLTVEMWVRFQAGDHPHWLCGDLIIGGNHPDVAPGTVVGWQLFIQQTSAGRHRVAVSTRDGYAHDFPVAQNAWHHIAFCSNAQTVTVFVDGKPTATGSTEMLARSYAPSPIPFHIGSHPDLGRGQPGGLRGDLRAFRISAAERYSSVFTPVPLFVADAETEVLLDFEGSATTKLSDVSKHERHGELQGATWVGLDSWPAVANVVTANSTPATPTPLPTAAALPASNAIQKEPMPETAAAEAGAAHVRDVFKLEFEGAKEPSEKLALADKLASLAIESQDQPAARYAMFVEAVQLAVEGHDVRKAFSILGELAKRFSVDELALKVDAVKKSGEAAKTTVDRRSVAEAGISLAEELVKAGRFDPALATLQTAIQQAGRAKEVDLGKAAREFRDAVSQAKRASNDAQAAKLALESNADDPESNLRWGRFLCFHQHNWEEGLGHLAKSNHDPLAKLAELDRSMPQSGEEQAALARGWADALKEVESSERSAVSFRAWQWARKAQTQLKGLAKIELENRIKDLESQLAFRHRNSLVKSGEPSSTAPAFQPPREFVGLLGRLQVNGTDAGILWKYETGLRITNQQLVDVLAQANVPRGKLRLEFVGVFYLPEAATVNIALNGGSATGISALLVDNNAVGEVGGMRPTADVYKMQLQAGEHAIRWVLSGDNLGTSSLAVTNAANAQPLSAYHNPQLLTLLRDSPSRARLNVNMLRNQ